MNRNDELRELQMLCAETPPELEFTVQSAVERAARKERRQRRVRRIFAPVASLAGTAAIFVILVNASVPFAMACNRVPGLREVTQMVAYDPSLRLALEHEYIQLVKQTASDGDLTVSLEYLIADKSNLILFYRADDQNGEPLSGSPQLLDENGVELEGYSASWAYPGENELQHAEFLFTEGEVPARFGVKFSSEGEENDALEYEMNFPRVDVDPAYRVNSRTITVGETVELLGQKITVDTVEVYPLQTRIKYHYDENNTAKFTRLPFYLLDSAGNEIANAAGGITGVGDRDAGNAYTAILDTIWWDEEAVYTLCVDRAAIIPYDEDRVHYDPETDTFTGLPNYITVRTEGDDIYDDYTHALDVHTIGKPDMQGPVFAWEIVDAATGERVEPPDGHASGSLSWRADDPELHDDEIDENTPGYFRNIIDLRFVDRPVILKRYWAPTQMLEKPIRVPLY